MALVSALSPLDSAKTGDLQWTVATVSSLTGLQEVEPGWMLVNGVTLPSSGNAPSGAPYAPLYAKCASLFGTAGSLPNLINGVAPLSKGASTFTSIGGTGGLTDVTLATGHTPAHNSHSITVYYPTGPDDGSGNNFYCVQSGNFQYPRKTNLSDAMQLANSGYSGGGGSHENMPPFFVVEGCLVKL